MNKRQDNQATHQLKQQATQRDTAGCGIGGTVVELSLIHILKVNVVNIEKAVAVYHNPHYQDETVFYLFTRPQDALAMVRQGVKIGTLHIGGMAWRPGKKRCV